MLIPSVTIPLLCISLLLRVLIQAKKMKRTVTWRSTRKMTIQLTVISILYLIFWFPLALVSLIRIYFIPTFIDEIAYLLFILYTISCSTFNAICMYCLFTGNVAKKESC